MVSYSILKSRSGLIVSFISFFLSACGPRVIISTGTTIGLKATPGDGNTRPPQVTLAYKRAELALVPTKKDKATTTSDAFSTLAALNFSTKWFGDTEIHSFIGTGIAAREIQSSTNTKSESVELESTKDTVQPSFWNSFSEGVKDK